MIRHATAILILAFFTVMMTLLVRDHVLPRLEHGSSSLVSGAQLAEVWNGTDEWMSLYFNGAPVGAMRQRVSRTETGYLAQGRTMLRAGFLAADLVTVATLNERLEITRFKVSFDTGADDPLELAGVVEGLAMNLRLKSPTGVRFTRTSLKQPPTLNISSDALFASRMMRDGQSYLMDVYDPLWGMNAGTMRIAMIGTESIEVDGETYDVKMAEAAMQNIRMRIWLDDVEVPLRREISWVPSRGHRGRAGDREVQPSFVLRLDRIMDEDQSLPRLEPLWHLPEAPDLTIDKVRGKNRGEPLDAFGLLPILLKSRFESLQTEGQDTH